MKVEVLQSSFKAGLSAVSRVVSSKPNLPILGNILISANKDHLILAATDLDVGMKLKLKAKVIEEGSICVPSRIFVDFISSISSDKVLLKSEETILKAESETYKSSFNCLDSKEFPSFPQRKGEAMLSFSKSAFTKGLAKVLFSTSTDTSRQILNGVLFEFEKKGVKLISTDGFRLSSQSLQGDFSVKEKLVIPARGLQEVIKIGDIDLEEKGEEEIKIFVSENEGQLIIESRETEIVLRLLEGSFPNYKRIIPSEFESEIKVSREELLQAVKVASIFARDNANIINLSLDLKTKKMSISAQSREIGEGFTTIDVEGEGNSLELSFNSRFLLESLSVFSLSDIALQFSGSLKPVIIKEVEDKSFFHVLMPVKTGS